MPIQVPPVPFVAPVAKLLTWRAEPARCGDATVASVAAPRPAAALTFGAPGVQQLSYRFSIAADGRVRDIVKEPAAYVGGGEDIAPALAAARFAPGARTGCTVRFVADAVPVADAPMADVFAFAARGVTGGPVLARIRAAAGDCGKPPALRLRAFPDFDRLPRTLGAAAWTVTRFDLDASGRPVAQSVAASSGDAPLDAAALDSVKRSRFANGVRHGCLLPTELRGATLPAPPAPEENAFRPAGATCPRDLPFDRQPTLTTPAAWQRRSIEGWAMVAYDVAPWGAIGNARVLAAEPAAEFGDWALNVVRYATKRTSGSGYTGCVDRVRFRIDDEEALRLSAPPPPPIVD